MSKNTIVQVANISYQVERADIEKDDDNDDYLSIDCDYCNIQSCPIEETQINVRNNQVFSVYMHLMPCAR